MPLTAGDRLGPYEILSPLGEGGMGAVWKARDTRLGRLVAIKISRENFTQNFDREARAIGAISHPNICQIYDVGPDYLVMEYIEGSPPTGPLPLRKALNYALQILDALAAAHKRQIMHRDLKPANILVTKAGIVKLLDFGLAKSFATAGPDEETITAGLTPDVRIVGTLPYMSPEQLHGLGMDFRSDLFSFGCVLYELLSGRRPFKGNSAPGLIASILGEEPPPLDLPAPLERVIRTCLAKDPDARFQSASDLKRALVWASEELRPIARNTPLWPWAAALGLVLAALLLLWQSRSIRNDPLIRLDVELASGVRPTGRAGGPAAIVSPDGTRIVFSAAGAGGTIDLYIRYLGQSSAVVIPGTEGAINPFFSPDGAWLGFFAGGKLKKIPIEGGAATVLCDAPSPRGGTWTENGAIIAALRASEGLSRISAGGGAAELVTRLEAGEISHRWPHALPGGNSILYLAGPIGFFEEGIIAAQRLDTGERKALSRGGIFPRYLPTGHLTFVANDTLMAVAFDPARLELKGRPAPVVDDVLHSMTSGSAQFSTSSNGYAIYRSAAKSHQNLQWLDNKGVLKPLLHKPGNYLDPRVSPEGKRVALVIKDGGNADIWIYDIAKDSMVRITFDPGPEMTPVWNPDGRWIAYQAVDGIFGIRTDGSGKPRQLTHGPHVPYSFSPDGKYLAYDTQSEGGFSTVALEDSGNFPPTVKSEESRRVNPGWFYPSFSPDGRWLAYVSTESGLPELYITAFPSQEGKWQVSQGGGQLPEWSPDGRQILYLASPNRLMVCDYSVQEGSISVGKPRPWVDRPVVRVTGKRTYSMTPDGRRLAIVTEADEDRPGMQVVFLFNFFDEVKRRLTAAAPR